MTKFSITCFDSGVLWDDFGICSDVVPFTCNFPRADIHELLAPDLLHQVIKGTFKDHLVMWVNEYLIGKHGTKRGTEIIDDIDRCISLVPAFPGLRQFPEGSDFKQWTGDDLKALMKVDYDALHEIENKLARFHHYRDIFISTGVHVDISLPRQHALKHYPHSIRLYGSPNGLCSSMMESKHIKAVKEPWQCSGRHKALVQMLCTNCRMDKMAFAQRAFDKQGMMAGTHHCYSHTIAVKTTEILAYEPFISQTS
ncbi:hypothetical protein DFH94DRAFT_794945 [Russula ochroleuca]|uniref:Uncharacterized protein n=1 Tax=Russula ochroleuca TaxID=152965 RepID=A0A9P5MSB2_9AGAM|nr:hypothetical protein DFH94DRAFT_794945 [Russula ochroleuca]